jgi:Flp pilus assembly protein TadD
MRILVLVLTMVLSVAPACAMGQDTTTWNGRKVVFKEATHCPIRAVDHQGRGSTPVFTVKRANREMLFLVAGQAGFWVPSSEVLPEEQLADYREKQRQLNSPQQRQLSPPGVLDYYIRGYVRLEKKNYDDAIADFNEVLRLNPRDARAYFGRASCWQRKHDFGKAIVDFNRAVQFDPRSAAAHNARAWIWATCADVKFRDAAKAIESARKACASTSAPGNATYLETLAAAHAEAGNFDEAVKAQIKANDLFASDEQRTRGLARLNLYQDKKPYRE